MYHDLNSQLLMHYAKHTWESKKSLIQDLEVNEVQLTAHLSNSQLGYSEFQQATV